MAVFGHGARRKIMAGTVASPNSPVFDLAPFITDISGDNSVDSEETTTLDATNQGGAKSFLYGNNSSTLELTHNFDKAGTLLGWLEDIKGAGVVNSDFNVMIFDYPFGNAAGNTVISRPMKITNYRMAGGISAGVKGSSSWQRSGNSTTGTTS